MCAGMLQRGALTELTIGMHRTLEVKRARLSYPPVHCRLGCAGIVNATSDEHMHMSPPFRRTFTWRSDCSVLRETATPQTSVSRLKFMAAQLSFVQPNTSQGVWNKVLWIDESKVEMSSCTAPCLDEKLSTPMSRGGLFCRT